MGVMAGGSFDGKIKEIVTAEESVEGALEKLAGQFDGSKGEWGLKVGFQLLDSERGFAVIGVSSPSIESKSFDIVKAGSDKSRENFQCPGIAHAGAYPMEIVLAENEGKVVVRIVNSMYRMKMFFEDAGKVAFAKNMTMPGSIQDDIEAAIKTLEN